MNTLNTRLLSFLFYHMSLYSIVIGTNEILDCLPQPLNVLWLAKNDTITQNVRRYLALNNTDVTSMKKQMPISATTLRSDPALNKLAWISDSKLESANAAIRKLSHIKEKYEQRIEYEIGHLTHEITYRYRILVELIKLSENPKMKDFKGIFIAFTYEHIMFYSMDIIHLSKMIHEVPVKHKNVQVHENVRIETKEERELKRKEIEMKKKARAKKNKKWMAVISKYGNYVPMVTKKKNYWKNYFDYGWPMESHKYGK